MQGLPASDGDDDIELLTVGPAPELTFDDKVVAFINRADPRGDGNDELPALAVRYLQVIPGLPRLAPRCATRAALALAAIQRRFGRGPRGILPRPRRGQDC